MSKPLLVSFVIPVYKKDPSTFERCLKSIFDSSLKEIEVIAVFDGPNEALENVAKRFPKVQSHVIEHGGAPKARNYGTSLATGKYVVCWDADCFIKPDAAKRWIQEFDAVPEADFVYSGYEFEGGVGGFDSEPFDAYSLTSGNYISPMAPIKREKAPKWDESLKAAQDWDFWLTAVEQGCKGSFIPGSGFITEVSREGSISAEGWALNKREETMRIVREKHGIPDRSIGVYSLNYPDRAIKLAKLLGADVIKATGRLPDSYKNIICFGYGFLSRFEGIGDSVTKIQYWLPAEIEGLMEAKYSVVMETIRIGKKVINLCNTDYEKGKLDSLGISAEVVSLPFDGDSLKNVRTELPKEFSVLVLTDANYGKLLKELQQDLPHIKFGVGAGKTSDYSAVLSFYSFAALDEALLVAHVNGRNVISNVQAPYCGFVDPTLTWDEFKEELYKKIHEVEQKPFNKEAQEYYLALVNPEEFKRKVLSYAQKPVLEVVS